MEQSMELGAFSISLTVKDIEASRRFYEKFGFKVFAGDAAQNWLILKNGAHVIGLFQGMFDKNILTFNPGWDSKELSGNNLNITGVGEWHNSTLPESHFSRFALVPVPRRLPSFPFAPPSSPI